MRCGPFPGIGRIGMGTVPLDEGRNGLYCSAPFTSFAPFVCVGGGPFRNALHCVRWTGISALHRVVGIGEVFEMDMVGIDVVAVLEVIVAVLEVMMLGEIGIESGGGGGC